MDSGFLAFVPSSASAPASVQVRVHAPYLAYLACTSNILAQLPSPYWVLLLSRYYTGFFWLCAISRLVRSKAHLAIAFIGIYSLLFRSQR